MIAGYDDVHDRAVLEARYIIENKATVRKTASKLGISKSTVHKDVTERLLHIDPLLFDSVRQVLDENKAERHLRGGEATKLMYAKRNAKEV